MGVSWDNRGSADADRQALIDAMVSRAKKVTAMWKRGSSRRSMAIRMVDLDRAISDLAEYDYWHGRQAGDRVTVQVVSWRKSFRGDRYEWSFVDERGLEWIYNTGKDRSYGWPGKDRFSLTATVQHRWGGLTLRGYVVARPVIGDPVAGDAMEGK